MDQHIAGAGSLHLISDERGIADGLRFDPAADPIRFPDLYRDGLGYGRLTGRSCGTFDADRLFPGFEYFRVYSQYGRACWKPLPQFAGLIPLTNWPPPP